VVPGVLLAEVNAAAKRAYIEYDPSQVTPERFRTVIEATGFGAPRSAQRRSQNQIAFALVISALLIGIAALIVSTLGLAWWTPFL
jgi:cation transport ATPase